MARRGKRYIKARKNRPTEVLSLGEGIKATKKLSYSNFDGSLELHLEVKIPKEKDPKSLKGSLTLPHSAEQGDVKIAVLTSKDNEAIAKEAGADLYDFEKLVEEVKKGNVNFDVAIATPDVMGQIAALGKVLGPKGLMPNPRTGTVTEDIAQTVEEYKKGKMNFTADSTGVLHFKAGKLTQSDEQLVENVRACVEAAAEALNKKADQVVKSAYLAPTMGASVEIELSE